MQSSGDSHLLKFGHFTHSITPILRNYSSALADSNLLQEGYNSIAELTYWDSTVVYRTIFQVVKMARRMLRQVSQALGSYSTVKNDWLTSYQRVLWNWVRYKDIKRRISSVGDLSIHTMLTRASSLFIIRKSSLHLQALNCDSLLTILTYSRQTMFYINNRLLSKCLTTGTSQL